MLHLFLCCFMLHYLNIAVLSSCTIFMFYFYLILKPFHPEIFSWCSHVLTFSSCNVFYIAPFFKFGSFHVFFCISPPVITLFSCCSFFMLHLFQFVPSLLTCFLFCFFNGALLFWLLFLTLCTLHIALFHVALISCCTFSLHFISHIVLFP